MALGHEASEAQTGTCCLLPALTFPLRSLPFCVCLISKPTAFSVGGEWVT